MTWECPLCGGQGFSPVPFRPLLLMERIRYLGLPEWTCRSCVDKATDEQGNLN